MAFDRIKIADQNESDPGRLNREELFEEIREQ